MSGLPEGWGPSTMGDIGRYLNGFAFNSKTWSDRGRPIIRIQNLTGSGTEFNYFDGDIDDRYIVRQGDLLFSWSATLGVFVWNGPEAVLNQHIFKVESKIDKLFHRYLIEQKIEEMRFQTHGSGMVHITKKKFDAIPVSIPPLPEQRRIVEILEEQFSRLDAAAASIRAVREKAEQFRRSLLHAAYTEALAKSESPDGVEIAGLVDSKASITDGPFGSNLKTEHYTSEGPTVVRLANIGDGHFIDGEAHISESHFRTLTKHEVMAGDVLVATLGERIPRACVAPEALGPAIVKADCIRIRPSATTDSRFLMHMLNSPAIRADISESVKGVTRPRLNLGNLRQTRVPAPSPSTQVRLVSMIEEQFSRLDAVLSTADETERRLNNLRRSILHAAFSGTLTAEWRATNG